MGGPKGYIFLVALLFVGFSPKSGKYFYFFWFHGQFLLLYRLNYFPQVWLGMTGRSLAS